MFLRCVGALTAVLLGACVAEPATVGQQRAAIVDGELTDGDPALGLVYSELGVCSGTLIAQNVLLTARHCLLRQDSSVIKPSKVEVYWGADPEPEDEPWTVLAHDTHSAADIAVLELLEPGPAEPVVLNTEPLDDYIGAPVRLVGYGSTAETAPDHGIKREGTTVLQQLSPTPLGDAMLTGETGAQTCVGDSGGPAFMTIGDVEQLVGVTSFGTGPCGSDGSLDAAIRVDRYYGWIAVFNERVRTDPTPPPPPDGCSAGAGQGAGALMVLLAVAALCSAARRRRLPLGARGGSPRG